MEIKPIIIGGTPLPLQKPDTSEVSQALHSFSDLLSNTFDQVHQAEQRSSVAIEHMHTGEAQNLHEIMIAAEEADISIRMLVQMRNKALEAYNEIMRMQI